MRRVLAGMMVCLGVGLLPGGLAARAESGWEPIRDERSVIQVVKKAAPSVVSLRHDSRAGSGVILRSDGLILTNAHVVGQERLVEVRLADGRSLRGRVLGRDKAVDIAVVKVEAENLPASELADSDALEVGQLAIAIGHPLGLERTVTVGVVSATWRRLEKRGPEGFVQTDVAISPGNSGGPLLDSHGRVVGINRLVVREKGATGLSFAVPINVAAEVARQLLEHGDVRRVRLGVSYVDTDAELAAAFGRTVPPGVVVRSVLKGSPAQRAGLREEDVITALGGHAITDGGTLRRALRGLRPGATVPMVVKRGAQTLELSVRLEELAS
jgi:serine protease Do